MRHSYLMQILAVAGCAGVTACATPSILPVELNGSVQGVIDQSDAGGTYLGWREDCIAFELRRGQFVDVTIDVAGFSRTTATLKRGGCGYDIGRYIDSSGEEQVERHVFSFQASEDDWYYVWFLAQSRDFGKPYTATVTEMSEERRAAYVRRVQERRAANAASAVSDQGGADLFAAFARGFNQQMAYMDERDRAGDQLQAEAFAAAARERAQQEAQQLQRDAQQAEVQADDLRQQKIAKASPSPATSSESPSAPTAAGGPLSFVLITDLRRAVTIDDEGNQANGICYSNVVTRPGPPPGTFDSRSGTEAARPIIQSYYPQFLRACREHGPASENITYDSNWGSGPGGPEMDARVQRTYQFHQSNRGAIEVRIVP